MTRAERSSAWREKMATERKCQNCAAGLQEDDTLFCVECTEARRQYQRDNPRRLTKKQKKARNLARRKMKASKSKDGKCGNYGCDDLVLPGERTCQACNRAHRISAMVYEREKTWPRIAALNIWKAATAPLRDKRGRVPMGYRKTRAILGLS